VPPAFRKDTKIIQLSKFNLKDVDGLMKYHHV